MTELMAKTRITITLEDNVQDWIYASAKATNKSQSEIVRICLREFMQNDPQHFSRFDKARTKSEDAWRKTEQS